MSYAEFEMLLLGRSDYIRRHRPLLMQFQIMLLVVGMFFYVTGLLMPGTLSPDTWGELAYFQPAWVWGAINASASAITAIGLMRPVKNKMVAVGAAMHLVQFSAICTSCFFSGGDFGVGFYVGAAAALHGRIFYEALRW